MSGNASEEGVMQQLGNPSHLDAGRVAVPAGAILGILSYVGIGAVSGLGIYPRLIIAGAIWFAVSGLIYRSIERRRATRKAARREAERADRTAETQRQLAARAAGRNTEAKR